VETAPAAREYESWRLAVWGVLVALMIAGAYAARLADDPIDDPLYRYETAVTGLVIYAFLLGIVLLVGRGLPLGEFFALRRPPSWGRALGLVVAAYVIIFLGAGLILIALDAGDEQGLTPDEWQPDKLGPYLANAVAVAIAAPFVEELMYRGAGMRSASPTVSCSPCPRSSSSGSSLRSCGCERGACSRRCSCTPRSTRRA
jgi:membrane protease YdiL (CAAX protease family)